jgi:hypothetical protein
VLQTSNTTDADIPSEYRSETHSVGTIE